MPRRCAVARSKPANRPSASRSCRRATRPTDAESALAPTLGRRDVLVQAEHVVRVVLPLQLLEAGVLRVTVRGAHALVAFLAEEVDVHGGLPRLEGRPEVTHPLPLALEALRGRGGGADVVGEGCAAAAECGLVLADARDGAAHLPDRERGQRRLDPQ